MTQIPTEAIKHLTAVEELDFSNNRLKTLPDTTFHFLKSLRILEMNDNQIDQLPKGTFQSEIHRNLEKVSLGFNYIRHISQHTFVDLEVSNFEKIFPFEVPISFGQQFVSYNVLHCIFI
jgi:Leucine-rich repeat (LRR) protein